MQARNLDLPNNIHCNKHVTRLVSTLVLARLAHLNLNTAFMSVMLQPSLKSPSFKQTQEAN